MRSELLQFEVLRGADGRQWRSNEIVLLLCLEESLKTEAAGETTILKSNDILLINPKTPYTIVRCDTLFVRYRVHVWKLREIFPNRRYRFFCNSTKGPNDNYILLRRYLTNLLLIRYEGGEFEEAESCRLIYEMLIFLVNNFALTDIVPSASKKIDDVTEYLDANFRAELSLNRVSEQFHMTPPAFSRFFKKEMGITFYQYLSAVRLEHAVEDLTGSDKNLLHVALDNGFPNAESFHNYFVKAFAVSPKQYRVRYRMVCKDGQEQQEALSLAATKLDRKQLHPESEQKQILKVDAALSRTYMPYWSEVLNLGDARLLEDYEGQKQIRHLQNTLNFRFARLRLDGEGFTNTGDYSFFIEERRLDYLIERKLRLWLIIDFRIAGKNAGFLHYLKRFMSHFANRYSLGTVCEWRFELIYNTLFDTKKAAAYWTFYREIMEVLEGFRIRTALLGPGIALGNEQGLCAFYEYMDRNGLTLPFHTLTAEPYTCILTKDGMSVNRATDSSYLKNALQKMSELFRGFSRKREQICITSWSDTLLRTNLMNDSCYRGADIIKNMIDCFGAAGLLAHGIPSDVAYTEKQQGYALFGGEGLLSKHGLQKPSFYAYGFMQRVGRYYLNRDAHSIVFGNGESNYQILCHNRKRLNHHYYLAERQLSWEHMQDYFDDLLPLELFYQFTNLKNGTYVIKSRSVSPSFGSVQDELHRMVEDESVYIHSNDLDYLRQIAVPKVRIRICTVTDGTMILPVALEANEFSYIHIIYQY